MADLPGFDRAVLFQRRRCCSCEAIYTIADYVSRQRQYFSSPHDYQDGCTEYCLGCWLGVGPLDFPEAYGEEDATEATEAGTDEFGIQLGQFASLSGGEGTDKIEDSGDLLARFSPFLESGCLLAVMPVTRIHLEWSSKTYRGDFVFYPPGLADLDQLNIVPNQSGSGQLAEAQSAASGVTAHTLAESCLVVFPCRCDWDVVRRSSHASHMNLIRHFSERVDRACLNLARYKFCCLDLVDTVPGRAGQVTNSPMMAGLCLYNHMYREGRIVGGAAFTHTVTCGLGLELEAIADDEFPRDGEVGRIVEHGLELYAATVEAATDTSRFIQAMSLLDYLADPDRYVRLEKIRQVVAKYMAADKRRYCEVLGRLEELMGKPDSSGASNGYRTRLVHLGQRLEDILPGQPQRRDLFKELDGYIHRIIDHMIAHSSMSWSDYLATRDTMRPFEN